MSTTTIATRRRCMALAVLGLLSVAPAGADAQTAGLQFVGHWFGRWADVTGAQWGTLDLRIGEDGTMAGVITNSALTGAWAGRIDAGGTVTAIYQYAQQQADQPAAAQGRWGVNSAGQLVGQMDFLFQGQKIGEGAFALTKMNSEGAGTASAAVSLCDVYRTLCKPYSGPQPVGPFNLPGYPGAQPIYPPNTLAPAMPMVVQSALDALPPAVRQALYRPEFAEAVRSGAIDQRIAGVLGGSVVPLLRSINGCGPGGACYTNQAALELLKGTSPLWPLGASMSPYALPLDRASACTATGACR